MSRLGFFERHAGASAIIAAVGNVGALWCAYYPAQRWLGRSFVITFVLGTAAFFLAYLQARGK